MAVEIPVYVDIQGAFQRAAKEVSTAMRPLQDVLSAKTLKLNIPNVGKLKDILDSTTISAEDVAEAMSHIKGQMELLNVRGGFLRGGKMTKEAQQLTAAYAALEAKLKGGANAVEQAINGTLRLGNATKNTNNALRAQIPLLGQLTASLGAYISVHSLLRFAKQIRDVTGELEYQRVALQNLLQDEQFGAQLFERIKAAAVESPFRIKDLVTYTKQLAAYRIESYKLFDTTKRLADISAGLGVDMNRLILAYGQVRAASVLRGQELRQFTEAGIPLVELLAEKFTELRGRVVSTADVFKLISEREVPFSMISDIFEDLTDKGGMFYQMQEKQAKTLQGRWEKLKDTFDIALQSIGDSNTFQRWNNEILAILNALAENLRIIPKLLTAITRGWIAYSFATLVAARNTNSAAAAQMKLTAAERKQLKQIPAVTIKILGQATATKIATKAMIGQRAATNALSKAFWKLTSAMLSNPIGAIAAGVAGLITLFTTFRKKTTDIDESIKQIDETIEKSGNTISSAGRIDTLINRYERLSQKTNRTAKEQQSLSQTMMTLQQRFHGVNLELNNSENPIKAQVARLKELNKEQKELAVNTLNTLKAQLMQQRQDLAPQLEEVTKKYLVASRVLASYQESENKALTKRQREKGIRIQQKAVDKLLEDYNEVSRKYNAIESDLVSIEQILNPVPDKPEQDADKKYLQHLRQSIQDITDAYKKYLELRKYMNKEEALGNISVFFPSLAGWEPTYENMVSKLEEMLSKYRGDADATRIIEQAIANIKFDRVKKSLDDALKNLSDEIKRSEKARNFFKDILDASGDQQLATNLTMSIYGDLGGDLESKLRKQLSSAFVLDESKLKAAGLSLAQAQADVNQAIIDDDYALLDDYLNYVVDANRSSASQILSERKDANASWFKDFQKTYRKAMSFQERINTINNQRQQKLEEARAKKVSEQDLEAINQYYDEKVAEVEVEALKNTDEWISSFEDLDKVGTRTLRNLAKLIRDVIDKSGTDLTPSLKILVDNLEEVEDTIANRNPFSAMASAVKSYAGALRDSARARKALKQGEDAEAAANLAASENKARAAIYKMSKSVEGLQNAFNTLNSIVSSVSDILNLDELSDGRAVLDGLAQGLALVGASLAFVQAILAAMQLNPIVLAITAVIGALVSISSIIQNLKIAQANREIKAQERALNDLERAYKRLGDLLDETFGSDHIAYQTQQIQVLQAKVVAYNAQLQAEQAKGKKASKDAIEGYKNSIWDTTQEIEKLKKQQAEWLSGSDVTSAAEAFTDAWLEAYKEYGNTAGAIEERMQEMVENIVKKAALAGVVQKVLQPWYDQINAMQAQDLTPARIAELINNAMALVPTINDGLKVAANSLQSAGVNLRGSVGSATGISRNIAGASEESINGLAQGINTQNFYISHVPTISQNVAAILAIMSGSGENAGAVSPIVAQVPQYMQYLPNIDANVAEMRAMLKSVISPKASATATHYVAVK